MQASPKTKRNRFIVSPMNTRAGAAIIAEAERVLSMRNYDRLGQIADILSRDRMPTDLRGIGQYYQGLVLLSRGQLDTSAPMLVSIAETYENPIYQAKALLALGRIGRMIGDPKTTQEIYDAASSIAEGIDLRSHWQAEKMKAVLASDDGNHFGALRQLQRIGPTVKVLSTLDRYDYLNSLAIELAETQNESEAIAIAEQMGTWPVLNIYPEFMETRRELLRLRHSKMYLHSEAIQEQNVGMAAPQIDRVPELVAGRVLPFERPQRQSSEGTSLLIMIEGYSVPVFKGTMTDKQIKRLFRLLDNL